MKKIIFVTLNSLLITTTVHAQAVRKTLPTTLRVSTQNVLSGQAMRRYLPINRATPAGNVMVALERHLNQAQAENIISVDFNANRTPTRTVNRSWLEQQKRNYKAWQLKRQHSAQLARKAEMAALPQLRPEEAFYTRTFEHLVPDGTIPTLPLIEQPDYLYRGLELKSDGAAVKNILENGLLVQDAGQYSNQLLVALTTTPEDAALASASKYTNLTKSPQIAFRYAQKNHKRSTDKVLPVIVAVQGEVEYANVVRVQHDIPTENIPVVILLLQVNQTPTWCQVTNTEDGFLVIPYEVK